MKYLLRKGGYYYRPDSCGYTSRLFEAGLFEERDALDSSKQSHGEVQAIPLSDITERRIHHLNQDIGNAIKVRDELQALIDNEL